jgi:hypothetical protein
MNITVRSLHRDLAYFYVGLIIAFSLSGIFLNHRAQFDASEYTLEVTPIQVELPPDPDQISDEYVASIGKQLGIESEPKAWRSRNGELRVMYKGERLEIDLSSGKGERESFFKIPVLAQTMTLHKDTSNWWIYYSDVFGVAMLVIAITGMFIQKGSKSFRKRGWIFALVGILFPLAFLFLIA